MRAIEQPLLHIQQKQEYNDLKDVHKTQRQVIGNLQKAENKLGRQIQRLERDDASSIIERLQMKRDDVRSNRADLKIDRLEQKSLKQMQHNERSAIRAANRAERWQSSTYDNSAQPARGANNSTFNVMI